MKISPQSPQLEVEPEGMGRPARIAAIMFMACAVAFWVFAFSPWARQIFQAPDQLEDEAFVVSIESRCALALGEMDALPSIRSATGPNDRADNLELANASLRRMMTDLATMPGGTDADERLVRLWMGDWEIYLADREAHVERLRTEGDVRFLNTEADGIFIAERMSGFARVNEIRSCLPPGDL